MNAINNPNVNPQEGEVRMSIFDVLETLVGEMDRPLKRLIPAHHNNVFLVDAIRLPEEEQGAFLTAAGLTNTVRMAVNVSEITPNPDSDSKLFLFSDPNQDGTIRRDKRGIMHPGDESTNPTMTPGLDVSACVYNDAGRMTREFVFNTDEWSVAHLWVNNETTIELILVPTEDLVMYHSAIKAGHGLSKPGGRIYEHRDGRNTAFEILDPPIGFGTIETLVRAWETAIGKSAGVIMAMSGMFKTPYQIISEELIDNAVQFDLEGVGKAMKRLNTMDRTAQVNNVVRVEHDSDQMLFYMFESGQIPDTIFEGLDPKRMAYMQEKFFDGAVFVSQACMARLRQLMIDRYEERGLNVERGLVKFDKPMTHQVRISGGGLIDQHGNKIGMEGHIKAHVMIAGGIINERMEDMGIDFLGTSDSFKTDLAVTVEDVIAVVVQPKGAKTELHTSAQHYSAAGLVNQDREDYLQPRARQFQDRLAEIASLRYDEDKAWEAVKAMAEEIEEDGDELLGEVRKGANEVLATYATLGMRISDSPAAMYALQSNMIQKLGYATLDDAKNKDMSSGGFGRNIDMPASGYYAQIFPEAFVYASGNWCPQIKEGELYTYSFKNNLAIGIISNKDWEKFLSLTGDGDLDDFWNVYFSKRDGNREALVMRHPAVHGEYMMFNLVASKALLDTYEEQDEKGYIPSIKPEKLATRLDLAVMPDGSPLKTMSVEDVHVQVFGGNPDSYSRSDALTIAKTYVQQLSIAATVVLGDMVVNGETSQLETSYFMGRPIPNLSNVSVDEFVRSRTLNGPIRGSMRAVLKGVESVNVDTVALHSQIREGVDLVPSKGRDFLSYALSVMHGVMKFNMEQGILGGVTYIRNSMEKWLKKYLQEIVNLTFDDHGIHTVKTTQGYAYDTQSESQVRLYVLGVRKLEALFGEDQEWKKFTNHGRFFPGITRRAIMPSDLNTNELGELVVNSNISRYVPAASWVRYVYTKRYEHYTNVWDRENKNPELARPIDLISRRSWKDALLTVHEDIGSNDDVYEFVLALYYVLRATPNISIHELTNSIREVFGTPGNVLTERLLYTSPFMRWNEEGKNVVLSAFEYAQTYKSAILSTPATPFVPVVITEGAGKQYVIFVPEDEEGGSITVLPGN